MKIIKIKKNFYDTEKLTYQDYLSLIPKGTKDHFRALTGKDVEPTKVKEVKKEEKPFEKSEGFDIKEEKISKVTKEKRKD